MIHRRAVSSRGALSTSIRRIRLLESRQQPFSVRRRSSLSASVSSSSSFDSCSIRSASTESTSCMQAGSARRRCAADPLGGYAGYHSRALQLFQPLRDASGGDQRRVRQLAGRTAVRRAGPAQHRQHVQRHPVGPEFGQPFLPRALQMAANAPDARIMPTELTSMSGRSRRHACSTRSIPSSATGGTCGLRAVRDLAIDAPRSRQLDIPYD